MPTRSTPTPTDSSLRALRRANPRNRPGFEDPLERYDALRTVIAATPVAAPRTRPVVGRRRMIGIFAAAAAALSLAGILVGLTLSAASPQSAYAQAKKAIAATSAGAVGSGTMTLAFGIGSHSLRQTVQWNGNDISISGDHMSSCGARRLLLIGKGAYVQRADGTWLHYPSASAPCLLGGPARTLVAGSRAEQILALVAGLHKTVRPDGSAIYKGTIPASDSAEALPTDDIATRLGGWLKSVGTASQFRLVVERDGLVRQMRETADDGSRGWNIQYTQLGTSPPISPPATFTQAAPGTVPRPLGFHHQRLASRPRSKTNSTTSTTP